MLALYLAQEGPYIGVALVSISDSYKIVAGKWGVRHDGILYG